MGRVKRFRELEDTRRKQHLILSSPAQRTRRERRCKDFGTRPSDVGAN